MARLPLLLPTAAALVLAAAPAAAQHISSPYRYIEPRAYGAVFGGRLSTQSGVVGVGPTSGNTFGGEFGYRLSGPFEIALTVGYASLQRAVRDTLRLGPPDTTTFRQRGTSTQGLLSAMAAVRFDITGPRTWHGFQPYALFGVGAVTGTTGATAADALVPADVRFKFGTSFAAQIGGGIEWYATRRLGLRLDGRGTLWKLHTPSAFLIRQPTLPASEWTQNASLVGAVAVHF